MQMPFRYVITKKRNWDVFIVEKKSDGHRLVIKSHFRMEDKKSSYEIDRRRSKYGFL